MKILCNTLLCLVFIIPLFSTELHARALPPKLFGSTEIQLKNKEAFGQWAEMWRRHNLSKRREAEAPAPAEPEKPEQARRCVGKMRVICNKEAWEKFIAEQDGKSGKELLDAVNAYINRSKYIIDPINWGLKDYWATPNEFMLKDGDCEDYAISKYITLKRLGVDQSKMRLVVVQDENLRIAHAVLAVYLEDGIQVLDNQIETVISHDQIMHYRTVYSLNENGWWLHQRKRFGRR